MFCTARVPVVAAILVLSGCSVISPMAATAATAVAAVRTTATLQSPSGRAIDVQLLHPSGGCRGCPLVMFSHGANAAPDRYDVLLEAWARGGWVVAAPLHVDSEDHPERAKYQPTESLALRLEDYDAIATAFGTPGQSTLLKDVEFSGVVVAAGHSYGALIAQIAGGARLDASFAPNVTRTPRPLAVVAISPPGPIPNYVSSAGWSQVSVPQLVVTGTRDIVPGIAPEWQAHLVSYEAAPVGKAYGLVFDGMDHYFNGAYGREAPTDASADQAVALLNERVVGFVEGLIAGVPDLHASWPARSAGGVSSMMR